MAGIADNLGRICWSKSQEVHNMEQTAIVRIHRPELTAQEREKRMEAIKKAAARLIEATARKQ